MGRDRKKKLTPLVAMSIYAREHGISYGEVQTLVGKGKLSYEQLGCEAERSRYAPPKVEMKICPVCGLEFPSHRSYQKFCSATCQRESRRTYADYHKRRAENEEEQPENSHQGQQALCAAQQGL